MSIYIYLVATCWKTMHIVNDRMFIVLGTLHELPLTPPLCPFSIQITVAGGGITWQMDSDPSKEEQATRVRSSLANFTLLTC